MPRLLSFEVADDASDAGETEYLPDCDSELEYLSPSSDDESDDESGDESGDEAGPSGEAGHAEMDAGGDDDDDNESGEESDDNQSMEWD